MWGCAGYGCELDVTVLVLRDFQSQLPADYKTRIEWSCSSYRIEGYEMTEYNIYCDESCHLENDGSTVMVLGALILPASKSDEVRSNILRIKHLHGVKAKTELKWTKASTAKFNLYRELVDYFFIDDDLRYRIVVANKTNLHHADFDQSHDDWYYKMYYLMLMHLFSTSHTYNIYIDVKDTHSYEKALKLLDICANKLYDHNHECVKKIQPIRSDEVQAMQIVDIINGAVCRANRLDVSEPHGAKAELIEQIKTHIDMPLNESSSYGEQKFNLFQWGGR